MPNQPFHWLKWALLVSLLLIGWAIFTPTVNRASGNASRMKCQDNLKAIMLAVRQYNQDFDATFPSLDTPAGWREAISPYAKKAAIFQCPNEAETAPQSADYFFNARLSGLSETQLDSRALKVTLAFGEGYASTDPRVSLSQLPKSWLADLKSPVNRHLDGSNFAFVDGHVKWMRPEKVTTLKTAENASTFAFD